MPQANTNKGRWVCGIPGDIRYRQDILVGNTRRATGELSCPKEAKEARQAGRPEQALVVGDGRVAPCLVKQAKGVGSNGKPAAIGWSGRSANSLEDIGEAGERGYGGVGESG